MSVRREFHINDTFGWHAGGRVNINNGPFRCPGTNIDAANGTVNDGQPAAQAPVQRRVTF